MTARRMLMVSQHPYPTHPQVYRNVQYLLGQGIEVDLVSTASAHLPDWSNGTPPTLHLHRIRMQHRRTNALRYLLEYLTFFVRALPVVCRLSLRHRYDAVQVDNLPDALVFVAFLPRWRGARIVLNLFEHMAQMTSTQLGIGNAHWLVRLTRWFERRSHRWADHVLSVSETGRTLLLDSGLSSDRISVIPNSMPPQPGPTWSPTRPPVLLVLTTLTKRYGVQVLIRALTILGRRRPDLTVRVLGNGEYRSQLIELATDLGVSKQVSFHPFMPWSLAMDEVRQAAIGVVPLMPDPYCDLMLPTKLLDYVEHGLPVVCSQLPTIAAVFPSDTVAYFAPGDPAGLAAQVERLLQHPEAAREQARRARLAMQPISWEMVAPRYLRALGFSSRGAR